MKKVLLLLCVLVLSACEKGNGIFSKGEPIETEKVGDFEVELLFSKNGCDVYRFADGGRYVYYSNCTGSISYSDISGSKDKSTIRIETINKGGKQE